MWPLFLKMSNMMPTRLNCNSNLLIHNSELLQYIQVKAKVHPTMSDMEKVQSTLKQIVRDWSKDGEEERAACYNPIIEEIEANFPADLRYIPNLCTFSFTTL